MLICTGDAERDKVPLGGPLLRLKDQPRHRILVSVKPKDGCVSQPVFKGELGVEVCRNGCRSLAKLTKPTNNMPL
jgi:hypothetical protein